MKIKRQERGWPTTAAKARSVVQARALRKQAAQAGLRFEAYLPPRLATWLLKRIERGTFHDPSEAVFVILGEHRELEPHSDLRDEVLRRRLQSAIDDPKPSVSGDQLFRRLRRSLATRPEPARWKRRAKLG